MWFYNVLILWIFIVAGIAPSWLDDFLADHHLPRNVIEFLHTQRKVMGSNVAHPVVHGREIQNILQAYLTLDFPTREKYVIFAFYFGAQNIDYQPTLTTLMANSNNNNTN